MLITADHPSSGAAAARQANDNNEAELPNVAGRRIITEASRADMLARLQVFCCILVCFYFQVE